MAQPGHTLNITPWHHIELNYHLAAGFQIRNLKWPKFDLCCLAEASSGNWAWCHPKGPLVNGPWDAGQPWLLGASQLTHLWACPSYVTGPAIRGSTLSYSLAQEHLVDSMLAHHTQFCNMPQCKTHFHCTKVSETAFFNRPRQEFSFKSTFSGKDGFLSEIHVFLHPLATETLMPVRKRSAWKAKWAVCSLIF